MTTAKKLFGSGFTYTLSYPQSKQIHLFSKLLVESVYSLLLCILFIFLIFSVQYRSIITGALALIPNILTGLVMYGFMGYWGMFINPFNIATFVIVLSIGVDFTIHMYTAFRRQMIDRPHKSRWVLLSIYQVIFPLFIATFAFSVPMMLVLFSVIEFYFKLVF